MKLQATLGSFNIHFSRKVRFVNSLIHPLLKAINKIPHIRKA
jgi:hypothetical protein